MDHRARLPRRALALLFAVWLVLLVWLVLWKFHAPYLGRDDQRAIKLVPFVPVGDFGASAPYEVLANLLLFVPLGVYLALLAPSWRWHRIALVAAGASLALEVTEWIIAVGSSDITDVIVNTAGALAGIGLVDLARRRLGTRLPRIATGVLTGLTLLAFVVIGIHIASFPAPPPGTVVMR